MQLRSVVAEAASAERLIMLAVVGLVLLVIVGHSIRSWWNRRKADAVVASAPEEP